MINKHRLVFKQLKGLDFRAWNVTLALVREYKRDRMSQYTIKYIPIDKRLENRLKNIIVNHINNSNTVEEYTFDCPEPEEDQVRAISYDETDFYRIMEQLGDLNPEEDIIENIDQLVKSKAYMIILRNADGIQVVGFKILPENWRMKRNRGLIPLLYNENRFEDLEQDKVFSISGIVDLFYYKESLFILSKKDFEKGLNFREGMISNAKKTYEEFEQLNILRNMEILISRVGNNQRYLRKIATIRNLGYYKSSIYMQRLQKLSLEKNWNIRFSGDQIEVTEDTIDDILTLLQNKRLHSQLTEEDFDVESTKPVGINSVL